MVEPVVQGAGGMRFYSPAIVSLLRALCDEHGLLLVLDEIATGFGRTGELWAADHAGRDPGRDVRRQGADRGLHEPGGDPVRAPCGPRDRRRRDRRVPARADVHGQPAGLLGRPGQPGAPRVRQLARRRRAHREPAGGRTGTGPRPAGRPRRPRAGGDRRRPARPVCRRRPGDPGRRARGCGCARSAISSTRCRPTSPATRIWSGSRRRWSLPPAPEEGDVASWPAVAQEQGGRYRLLGRVWRRLFTILCTR